MMRIHIFNPEHDIALAANAKQFTAPHAARQLRHDLGFLPMLWAEEGDVVLVDDVEVAAEALRHLGLKGRGEFISHDGLAGNVFAQVSAAQVEICPWGWDLALRQELKGRGVPVEVLPSNGSLNIIRQMSHRAWAAEHLLAPLRRIAGTVGEAREMRSTEEVERFILRHKQLVLKAPWSSSGRGVRYVAQANNLQAGVHHGVDGHLAGWIRNIVLRQGCVMAEPYYNKVMDFGMELESDGKGGMDYRGLSLFHSVNGAYTGNLLAAEEYKEDALAKYIDRGLLASVRERLMQLLGAELKGRYAGQLGVDMMIVRDDEQRLWLHPCVELNLRSTMGHVAQAVSEHLPASRYRRVMRITYTDKYRLRIETKSKATENER